MDIVKKKREKRAKGEQRAKHAARRGDAETRQLARNARSPKEQLAHLDKKLGVGVGAERERAKLQAQL